MALDQAWQEVPTVNTSEVLTARLANIYESNLRFLHGVATGPQVPFAGNFTYGNWPGVTPDHDNATIWAGWYRRQSHGTGIKIMFTGESMSSSGEMYVTAEYVNSSGVTVTATMCSVTGLSNYSVDTTYTYGVSPLASFNPPTGTWVRVCLMADVNSAALEAVFRVKCVAEVLDVTSGWTTPPTIADGSTATATDINKWKACLDWLKTRILLPNAALCSNKVRVIHDQDHNTYGDERILYGSIVHRGNTLRYRDAGEEAGDDDHKGVLFKYYYNSTLLTPSPTRSEYLMPYYEGTYSTDLASLGLTLGTLYDFWVTIDCTSGSSTAGGNGLIYYILEDSPDTASLGTWHDPAKWVSGDYGYGNTSGQSRRFSYLSSNLTWLYNSLTSLGFGYNLATREYRTDWQDWTNNGLWPYRERKWRHALIHKARWLHYTDEATIVCGGILRSVTDSWGSLYYRIEGGYSHTLDDPAYYAPSGGMVGAFDLDSLEWLKPGMMYWVEGKNHVCVEDWTA